jgi:hypothetical protein
VPGLDPQTYAKFPHPPESRAYVHLGTCGGVTQVSGNILRILCRPDSSASSTICSKCNRDVRMRDVAWADTSEPLADYHKRMKRIIPSGVRVRTRLLQYFSILGGMIGGLAISYPFWSMRTIAPPFIGFTAGLVAGFAAVFLFFRLPKIDYRVYR